MMVSRRKYKDIRRNPTQIQARAVMLFVVDPMGSVIARKREKIDMT